ncbi:hypothetical protein Tco_1366741, partial [Tanacetum coccineum]
FYIGIGIDIDIGIGIGIDIGVCIYLGDFDYASFGYDFYIFFTYLASASELALALALIADVFGSTWFRMILLGYTSALHIADVFGCQIADVFGCMVTRLLYNLQICLVLVLLWLVCMHLFGLLQIETSSSIKSALWEAPLFWYQEPKFLIKMSLIRNMNINDVYERIMSRIEERLDQFVDQLDDRMNDMMDPKRCGDRNGQRSKDEESKNPFFKGDGSSLFAEPEEWEDDGVAGDDYKESQVFDND